MPLTRDVQAAQAGDLRQRREGTALRRTEPGHSGGDRERRRGEQQKRRQHAQSSACLVAGIAYVSGKQIERVRSKDGSYDVTEIMIVGVATPYGMLAIEPSVVYTLLKVNEERRS